MCIGEKRINGVGRTFRQNPMHRKGMDMLNQEDAKKFAAENEEAIKDFLREFAPIPAPSHKEDLRVAYLLKKLPEMGFENAFADEAKNVIVPIHVTDDNDLVVFAAHTDVVFPDETPLPFKEDDEKFYCPGIGDDTGRLVTLITAMQYFVKHQLNPKTGVLLVANSCEEGLGNLDGTKYLFKTYGNRIKEFISVDGGVGSCCQRAVGSHRYEISLKAEGGHSFGNFGNTNAIHLAAKIINALYEIAVPKKEDTKTTFNVGVIEGGTSVNTIAEAASFMYEYRSNDRACLAYMKEQFEKVIEAYRSACVSLEVKTLGERPCNGDVNPGKMAAIAERTKKAYEIVFPDRVKEKPFHISTGSTDSNIPLSLGIPASTIGATDSLGAHKRSEWLDHRTLKESIEYLITFIAYYFEV